MSTRALALTIASLLCTASVPADDGVLRDGTSMAGTLGHRDSKFTFGTADADRPIDSIEFVRFKPKSPFVRPAPLWHRVQLSNGELFLGEILKLDDKHLHVRTAWANAVRIPRATIDRVGPGPGGRPVFLDIFDGELTAWAKSGQPKVESGQLLLAAGDAVEVGLKSPVTAGRVCLTFQPFKSKSRIVMLELGFVRDGTPASVAIELIGPGPHFAVTPGVAHKIEREGTVRQVVAVFDRERLVLLVDDLVLWSQDVGPGVLKSVKLIASGEGDEMARIEDIAVLESDYTPRPRPWADLTRDAVRSADGDETFGTLTAAGPTSLRFEIKGTPAFLSWPAAYEFAFRRGPVAEATTTGEHVRVRVRSADGARDVLDGSVKSFDATMLVLTHAVLGELAIPRDRLEEIRLRFYGRRVSVESSPHHLGKKPAFGYAVPKPEGMMLTRAVKVDAVPHTGSVVIEAAGVDRTGSPAEVWFNGKRLGDLNRLADRAGLEVKAYALPVPSEAWERGENAIEIRLLPAVATGRVNGIDVRAVRLELYDAR